LGFILSAIVRKREQAYSEGHAMRKLAGWLLFFGIAVPGFADVMTFSGTFGADDQVKLFNIVVTTPETVTIQTYGYAGGSAGGNTYLPGGFAPVGFLFDNLGDVLTLTSGTCAQVGADPVTGNCDDLYFQDTLGPGTYTLALAVDDNRPVGSNVADGFLDDGNPGFTCNELGVSGSFCDLTTATGASRTGDYALSITTPTLAAVPEPASGILLLTGGAIFALRRRRIN
jgi:hypothetical protein